MKKILVTGGAGFIGSHILEKCSEVPGLSVTVLDNLSSGFKEYVPLSMNLVQMDVRDKALIDFLLQEKFDTVIHLAAQTLVPFSMEYPLVDADINIKGLINLLEGCRKSGVKRIIFSSSAAVYGDNQHLPLTEKEIPAPTSFYGLSKVTAESYIRLYCLLYGMHGIILRFANVYGERQGETGEGGVISIFARLLHEHKPLTVFGDGQQTRDFIYVGDIAETMVRSLSYEGLATLNVSTGCKVSLNALLSVMEKLTGQIPSVQYGPRRKGDIRDSVLSHEALQKELGPMTFTSLQDGLFRTLAYFSTHP